MTVAPTRDGRIWHFCDMERYRHEGSFEFGKRTPAPNPPEWTRNHGCPKARDFRGLAGIATDRNQCPDSSRLAHQRDIHYKFGPIALSKRATSTAREDTIAAPRICAAGIADARPPDKLVIAHRQWWSPDDMSALGGRAAVSPSCPVFSV